MWGVGAGSPPLCCWKATPLHSLRWAFARPPASPRCLPPQDNLQLWIQHLSDLTGHPKFKVRGSC